MSLGFFIWDVKWSSSGASAFALNMYKCNVASLGFIIMCLVRGFTIAPSEDSEDEEEIPFSTTSVGYLILSSTLGIIIGDNLWLEALRLLGAKHVIVIDSIKPFAAAILGRVGLDEVLKWPTWIGMGLTVIGVGIVSWEEQTTSPTTESQEKVTDDDVDVNNKKSIEQTEATDRIVGEEDTDAGNKASISQSVRFDTEEDTQILSTYEDTNANNADNTAVDNSSSKAIQRQNTFRFASRKPSVYRRGYICAILNVLADSYGSLLTKQHGAGMTTWAINLVRFGFAGVVLICISTGMRMHRCLSSRRNKESEREAGNDNTEINNIDSEADVTADKTPPPPRWFELPSLSRIGWLQITTGVGLVTFLCPALSNFALFQIALGLAVSLGSIGPLYGLLLDWPFKGKPPTIHGCIGVTFTIAGVVMLCIWGYEIAG